MKILLSAYSCEPGKGSERGVGWNVAKAVAQYHEVWVLTRPDESRETIEAELIRNPEPNLHFVYFNLPILGSMWKWGFGLMQLHYYLWQIQAYVVARRLHQEINFDLAHHITFVKYSRPSFLAFLPIPLVWGPVGGGEFAPKAFWQDFSLKNKIYELVRLLACWIFEFDPFVRFTAKNSVVVKTTTEDTAARVRSMGVKNVSVELAISLLSEEITTLARYALPGKTPIRFISIGRLLHWKGFHLGLQAFAQANLPDAEYWIVGNGLEKQALQQMTAMLKISHQVKFWGELSREETLQKLGECTALIHPSLHDSGAGVCLEAMAAGRPVICLDLGGPAVQVASDTGFKVTATTPKQAVREMSKVIAQLAGDRELQQRMGEAGRRRVNEVFNWEIKGRNLAKLYQEIATQSHLKNLSVPLATISTFTSNQPSSHSSP
ncbi:glycosyltransferase family 4 protein [Anabaena sphaerica FACHB-251]|uniref:Glycosyltransferase family 4 protein n=1 Tax=Anabaena sphaerica FACHB-251 TaxID=2692883 RepID=A0A927A4G0_9NOST|nr:glycosyltransferase family 4 protein [Anabaena sphaerica]MBD2296495.1 glycosyltransferase family 4 protein [Anabaena sphaerica FACHB-251]